MRFFGGDLLSTYLQDHLGGATFGLELARRARDENEGIELGDFLATSRRRSRRTARHCSR